ncbi:lipase [Anaerolineaceae bacterium oral taxon 439]|nr:lipase [Anaerolineaceae bacterium oral taxon 439]
MANYITMKNICKNYIGVQALKNVDFSLEKGEIHCLVGGNGSGKSTLIKVLSGVNRPEPGGEIVIDGKSFASLSVQESIQQGIRVIYQDLALFPNLSIQENIAFQLYGETKSPIVDWRAVEKRAKAAMEIIGLKMDPDRLVGSLSIAEQQLVEITRALVGELKLLILDEPTASLTRKEVNALFAAIRRLQARGVTTMFVSHKMNEIFEIAERVTVIRDGEIIGAYPPSELDDDKLVYLMTGKTFKTEAPDPVDPNAALILETKNLTKANDFEDVSIQLRKGEILGITGLLGSGRTELALSIFGMNPPDSGEIWIDGKKTEIRTNVQAQKLHIAYVPEDRLSQGVILDQPILENLTVTVFEQFLDRFGLMNLTKRRSESEKMVRDLLMKISSLDAPMRTLSGGNQQKGVLAKWLATRPRLLILDEPTVGIDVYAKNSIYELIKRLAKEGMGIILISDEILEVLSNCHRVLVMENGKIVHELTPDENSASELLEKFNLA